MAKVEIKTKKKNNGKKDAEHTTKTWTDDDAANLKKKWATPEQYKVVKETSKRFKALQEARRTSCPYASPDFDDVQIEEDGETINDNALGGTNWADEWKRNDAEDIMLHEYLPDRSNLKSPLIFAPTQATMAEFQDNKVGVIFTPTKEEDAGKVKVHKLIHDYWESSKDIQDQKDETFYETLTRGTSVPFNGWQTKSRWVDIILSGDEAKSEITNKLKDQMEHEEEIQAMKDTLYKEMRPLTRREQIIEGNDCVYIPTNLTEVYIDDAARVMRGPAYEAVDICWVQIPSLEQFRAEFKNSSDGFVIKENIDKVESAFDAQTSYGEYTPFFTTALTGSRVELIRYFNKQTDRYIIIANDILIREGPLPYNHKDLPFSRHVWIPIKNNFYGMGMSRALESLNAEDETLRNMDLDQAKIDNNPPMFVNSDVFNDVDTQYDEVIPGAIVEIGGNVGPDNIRWMERTSTRNTSQLRDSIRSDAIMTSGVNPMAYSVPKPNEAVRNNIMSMESTLKMIKKGIRNWSKGWRSSVRQFIRIRQQLLPASYIEEIDDKGVSKKVYPTVPVENKKLDLADNELKEEEIKGITDFQIKDEYLSLSGIVNVQIDDDTLVPRSTALLTQTIQKALEILPPILSDPDQMKAPGVMVLVKKAIEIFGLGNEMTEAMEENSTDEQVQLAFNEELQMKEGEPLQGIPGQSPAHVMHHYEWILKLLSERDSLLAESVNLSQVMSGGDQPAKEKLSKLENVIQIASKHLAQDKATKSEAAELAVKGAQQIASAAQPGMQAAQSQPGQPMQPMGAMGGQQAVQVGAPAPTPGGVMMLPAAGGMPM